MGRQNAGLQIKLTDQQKYRAEVRPAGGWCSPAGVHLWPVIIALPVMGLGWCY